MSPLLSQKYYTAADIATRLVPAVSPLCVDADAGVREKVTCDRWA
jgi:hypothetical protein